MSAFSSFLKSMGMAKAQLKADQIANAKAITAAGIDTSDNAVMTAFKAAQIAALTTVEGGEAAGTAKVTPDFTSAAPVILKYGLDRRADVEMFRATGRTDAQVVRLAIAAAIEKKVPLAVPGRSYDCTSIASGWLIDAANVDYLCIEAEAGAELVIGDKGLRVIGSAASEISVDQLTLRRSTQATWNQDVAAVNLQGGTVAAKRNKISGFTDGLTFQGVSGSPIKLLTVRENTLFLLGEEPIVARQFIDRAVIENNLATRYLGDGILIKGARNVSVIGNRLTAPAAFGDADYASLSAGQTSNPNLPKNGGGITTNHEGGEAATQDVLIAGNHLENTSYGIGVVGGYAIRIAQNYLKNIATTTAIALAPNGGFNPDGVPVYAYEVVNNVIDGLLRPTQTSAIEAVTGTVAVERGVISGNIIFGNAAVGHRGIHADNKVVVSNNIVRGCQISIDCASHSVVTGNVIYDDVSGGRSITVEKGSTVTGNKYIGNTPAYIRGDFVTFVGNTFEMTGSASFVVLDGINNSGAINGAVVSNNAVSPVGRDLAFANGAASFNNLLERSGSSGGSKTNSPISVETPTGKVPFLNFQREDIAGQYWQYGWVIADGAGSQSQILHNGSAVMVFGNDGITKPQGGLKVGGVYNSGKLLQMDAYYFWVDTSGRLRIKSSVPTTDTDGTIVGSQS